MSPRTRFEIFKRDSFICAYCGRTPPSVVLEVDHVIPQSKGGSNDESNLVTACWECNNGKSNISLDDARTSTPEGLEIHRQRVEQLRQYNNWLSEANLDAEKWFRTISNLWIERLGLDSKKYVVSGPVAHSVRIFLKKLPISDIANAVDIAFSKVCGATQRDETARHRYFCGICWRMIKGD